MILPRTIVAAVILCLGHAAGAQVTNSSMSTADAFLCTGAPSNPELGGADLSGLNFGAAGTLAIAPASSIKGVFESVIMFNLAAGVAQFNAACGSNRWTITGVTLDLASNYGVAGVQPNNPIFNVVSGGQFIIEWLSDSNWVEGTGTPNLPTTDGVCYDSLPMLLTPPCEILCTNTYVPPGDNVHVFWPLPLTSNLVATITSGGNLSFLFYAADNQVNYLFNSYKYGRGNEPYLDVVAAPLLAIVSGAFTNAGFQLTGIGNNYATYEIQVSTNLAMTNWLTIGSATADGNGNIVFADASATNGQRFYRFSQ
jgi:hypothetical protein